METKMIKFGLFTSVEGHKDAEKELNEVFETLISFANESPPTHNYNQGSTDNLTAIAVKTLMRAVMGAERFKKYGATDTVCDENLVVAINERLNADLKRFQ